ncbi:XRE family transcriptional regulator [Solibacillus silvestris]|uniref:Rgg family transcriptional regulator n=1 Tax=Solibacillus silvestris TaxID=76853 RepID=UPI003F81A8C9
MISIAGRTLSAGTARACSLSLGAPAATLSSQNKFCCSRWSRLPSIPINSPWHEVLSSPTFGEEPHYSSFALFLQIFGQKVYNMPKRILGDDMKHYGKIIKEIRVGKGYSQQYVCENICTQGNYSKFEIEESREIKFSILNDFLGRLDISFEEFNYISNNYEMQDRQKILHQFYNQTYNSESALYKLKNDCSAYLLKNPEDNLLLNIRTVLEGMIVLAKSSNFVQATEILSSIWKDLSRRNTLYLSDIYLLNAILFIFPRHTAIEIKEFAFRHIEKYKGFQNINKLKVNFLINLSLIHIKEKDFADALILLNDAIKKCKKEQLFINLSICYVRKGICLNYLKNADEGFCEKGLTILRLLEQTELINLLEKEVNSHLLV